MIAIYPGTFDPITLGHLDVIRRAAPMFERVIVAVASDTHKQPFFPVVERTALAEIAVSSLDAELQARIEVTEFQGLLVRYARARNARVILRGLRAVSDFEYEVQLAGMNRRLAPELETVFLATAEQYGFVSSSLVRELARLKGDVAAFVPTAVAAALQRRFG